MKTTLALAIVSVTLVACATPVTTLENPKTKQIVTCGGGTAGSWTGGMVGYSIQQNNDADCVKNYESLGFKVLHTKTSSMQESEK